jgi:hypothetical protein
MNRHLLRAILLSSAQVLAMGTGGFTGCSTQATDITVHDTVVVPGTNHVIWRSVGGGYGPAIPAGASCHFESSYDLDMDAGSLAWSVCKLSGEDFSDPAAYATVTGSRMLDADERALATSTARAVTISNRTPCGADLDYRSLEVDSVSGSITYGDDFYACNKQFDHYVDNASLEALREVLDGLAHP